MKNMSKHKLNNSGQIDVFAVLFAGSVVLLICSLIFGIWAFAERSDYKNNVEAKVDIAVNEALALQQTELRAQFDEEKKSPNDVYTTPDEFGSIQIYYPRTWSAYVTESSRSSTPVDAFFNPNFVPGVATSSVYAMRLQVVNTSIDEIIKAYQQQANAGEVTVTAYQPKNVETDKYGYRVDGQIGRDINGAIVLLPLRDKTIKIWVESEDYVADLDEVTLEKLTYIP